MILFCFYGFLGQGSQWHKSMKARYVGLTRDLVSQGHVTLQVAYLISGPIHAKDMILFWIPSFFWVNGVNGINTRYVALTRDLVRRVKIGHWSGSWPWRTRSRVEATYPGYMPLTYLTRKPWKQNKNQVSSMYRSRDTIGNLSGHVTLTYKVTRLSHVSGLHAIDLLDSTNRGNKTKIMSLACIGPETR